MEEEMEESVTSEEEDMKHITYLEKRKRYRVQLRVKGHLVNCGDYDDLDDAKLVRYYARDAARLPTGPYPSELDDDAFQMHHLYDFIQEMANRVEDIWIGPSKAETGPRPNPSRRTQLELRVTELEQHDHLHKQAIGSLKHQLLQLQEYLRSLGHDIELTEPDEDYVAEHEAPSTTNLNWDAIPSLTTTEEGES